MNRVIDNIIEDIESISIDLDYYHHSDGENSYNRYLRSSDDIYLISAGFKVSNPSLSTSIWIGKGLEGEQWLADTSKDVIEFRKRLTKDGEGLLATTVTLNHNVFKKLFVENGEDDE